MLRQARVWAPRNRNKRGLTIARVLDPKKKKDAFHTKFRDAFKNKVLNEKQKVEKRIKKDRINSKLKVAFKDLIHQYKETELEQ